VGQIIVGVADYKISQNLGETIVTYALGSCIAVTLYDPVARVGGLIHYMLPSSSIDTAKARETPAMFADTGIPLLLRELIKLGADSKRLAAHLAGGSQILDPQGLFAIGKRNYIAAKSLLWKAGILVRGEAVGGTITRSFGVQIDTGQTWLKQSEISTVASPQGAVSAIGGNAYGVSHPRS
jgi:chemotaxis protein CheD